MAVVADYPILALTQHRGKVGGFLDVPGCSCPPRNVTLTEAESAQPSIESELFESSLEADIASNTLLASFATGDRYEHVDGSESGGGRRTLR